MINALKSLIQFLQRILSGKPHSPAMALSGDSLPVVVDLQENISRFIFEKRHVSNGKAKPEAFKPSSKTSNLSVYRTTSLTEQDIWGIAREYVENRRADGKQMIARGDLSAQHYNEQSLQFDADGAPHPRHANVVNWPSEKSQIKMIAAELALAANLVSRPPESIK